MCKNAADVDLVVKFNKTLSTEQKNMLLEVCRMAEEQKATKKMLAPFFACVFIGQPLEITDDDIKIVQENDEK